MKMLDIIIPVLNDKEGLYKTLFSFGQTNNKDIFVTIVDDGSNVSYDNIIDFFAQFFPIRLLTSKQNRGPGFARQLGLSKVTQPYVSFMDCGDVFVSPSTLNEIIQDIKDNPQFDMFSYSILYENRDDGTEQMGPGNNHIFGKVYKTNFLEKNNIGFCPDATYTNEDIGFNINCRFFTDENNLYENNKPVIIWKHDNKSITRVNNYEFLYKQNNLGLALNGEFAINNAKEKNVLDKKISSEIYSIMMTLYIFYCITKYRRPEYSDDALSGCLYFYEKCFRNWGKDIELMPIIWYDTVHSMLFFDEEYVKNNLLFFNFPEFLTYLETIVQNQ